MERESLGTRSKLLVDEWVADPQPSIQGKAVARHRHWPPRLVGAVGSLLVHLMLIPIIVPLGQTATPKLQELPGYGRAVKSAPLNSDEPLILIPMLAGISRDPSLEQAIKSTDMKPVVYTTMLAPDMDPPTSIATETSVSNEVATGDDDAADMAEQARFAGIYSHQIQARIEAVWRRPRAPIEGALPLSKGSGRTNPFECQVNVIQNERREVLEILLPLCNGSHLWQQSLVQAIRDASPLPAPPDPRAFRRTVPLAFRSEAFGPGSNPSEYQLETARTALVGSMDGDRHERWP